MPPAAEIEEKPAETTPVLTEAELEQNRQDFMAGFGFGDSEPKSDPKKEDPKPEPEKAKEEPKEPKEPKELKKEEKVDEQKKEPEEKPKKPAKAKKSELVSKEPEPQRREEIDENALADRIAERLKAEPAPVETLADPELTADDRATLAALDRLSKEPKYVGRDLVKETKAFWKREQDYATQWETANPGETFEATDGQHKAFYARNQPKYVPDDLEAARELVKDEAIQRRIDDQVKQKVEPELEQLRAREEMRRAQPEIERATQGAVIEMVMAAEPTFKAFLEDGDGNFTLTQEALTKMEADNPEAVAMLNEEAPALKHKIAELEKLSRLGRHYRYDPEHKIKLPSGEVIMAHQEIQAAGIELEESISQAPKADQILEGKQFITRGELARKQAAIFESRDSEAVKQTKYEALQSRFWYVEAEHIRQKLVNKSAQKVAKVLAVARKMTDRQAAILSKKAENEREVKAGESKAVKASPAAPALSAASDNVNTDKAVKTADDGNREEIDRAFFN